MKHWWESSKMKFWLFLFNLISWKSFGTLKKSFIGLVEFYPWLQCIVYPVGDKEKKRIYLNPKPYKKLFCDRNEWVVSKSENLVVLSINKISLSKYKWIDFRGIKVVTGHGFQFSIWSRKLGHILRAKLELGDLRCKEFWNSNFRNLKMMMTRKKTRIVEQFWEASVNLPGYVILSGNAEHSA